MVTKKLTNYSEGFRKSGTSRNEEGNGDGRPRIFTELLSMHNFFTGPTSIRAFLRKVTTSTFYIVYIYVCKIQNKAQIDKTKV